jgi:S-adenosylmethionine decarboxylase
MPLGKHVIAELSGCRYTILNNVAHLEETMRWAAEEAGATVVGSHFKRFEPQGVTGVLVLSESHLSIHTWPELGYAAVDCYTCGEHTEPEVALLILEACLGAKHCDVTTIERGLQDAGTYRMRIQEKPLGENSLKQP